MDKKKMKRRNCKLMSMNAEIRAVATIKIQFAKSKKEVKNRCEIS